MPYAAFDPKATVVTRPTESDLRSLADQRPPSVIVFEYPFESLKPLAVLQGVETLKIQDSGSLRTLAGIESLTSVRNLVISTPPTWDGTNRRIEVDTFTPLGRLRGLKRLVLTGVRPQDLDLSPIAGMTSLEEVDIGGVPEFVVSHYARLAAALPNAKGRCLLPYFTLQGVGFCSKCKGQQVMLNGTPPRARRWLCPKCNAKKLADHVAAWVKAGGSPPAPRA
jgi:hypothetical protein